MQGWQGLQGWQGADRVSWVGRYALKDSRFSSEILKYMALLRGAGKEPHAGAGAGGAGARAKAASTAWNPYFGNPGSKRATAGGGCTHARTGQAGGGAGKLKAFKLAQGAPSDGRPRSSVASRQASPANRPQSAPLACGSAAAPSGRGEGAANARSPSVALLAGIDPATTGTGGEAIGPAGHALEQSMAQVWG